MEYFLELLTSLLSIKEMTGSHVSPSLCFAGDEHGRNMAEGPLTRRLHTCVHFRVTLLSLGCVAPRFTGSAAPQSECVLLTFRYSLYISPKRKA